MLAFPRDSVNSNQLLYDVARFNFSSFVVRDFDLEQMSFGNVGLLIIKGFGNLKQLEHYRNVMAEKHLELPEGVRPIMISRPNFELLLREGRSFEEYFRYAEQDAVERTEEEVLNADVPDDPADGVPPEEEETEEEETPENPEAPENPEESIESTESEETTEPEESE